MCFSETFVKEKGKTMDFSEGICKGKRQKSVVFSEGICKGQRQNNGFF